MAPVESFTPTADTIAQASWAARYGAKHCLERVRSFPAGIAAPKKVRLYARGDHFILQFWDPGAKRTLSVRVEGDLIDAVAEARKVEARLTNFKTAGRTNRKLDHEQLVDRFLADLHRRADAGEVAAMTVTRYSTALRHYRTFCERAEIRKTFPTATGVNREFRLAFAAMMATKAQCNNDGNRATGVQSGPVFDALRAMFHWAADPERGGLLPDGFRNPFDQAERSIRKAACDLFGEPDITVPMAVDFLQACDDYQLPLFATLIFYGLRAAEPIYLFREHLEGTWLKVNCLPDLDYLTKGRRDKRFPLVPPLDRLLCIDKGKGLLFPRRGVLQKSKAAPLYGISLVELAEEYRHRSRATSATSAVERLQLREQVLHDAGGLNYDRIEHEFQSVAHRLHWPRAATLKDFRHLFSTCLENSGVPEFYRRYFMGQSPGKSAIVTYTHLNELEKQFSKAADGPLAPMTEVVRRRSMILP